MTAIMTPAQADTHRRRQRAAENLERARQAAREADRYGLLTGRLIDALAAAEHAYDQVRICRETGRRAAWGRAAT